MASTWITSARRLGLVPHYARGSVLEADGWQDLLHFVGRPVPGNYITVRGDVLMVGTWRGTPVMAAESVIFRTRKGDDNQYITQAFAPIEPALPLGLSVQPQGTSGGGAHLPDLVVGEPAFDAAYHVFAADAELVRPLLARTGQLAEVVDFLTNMAHQGVSVDIVDDRVRIYRGTQAHDARTLSHWFDSACWIAERLRAAALHLPTSSAAEAFLATLRQLATVLGLEVSAEQRAARGYVDDVEVWAHRSSLRGRSTTVIVAIIPRPFIDGLRIVKLRAGLPASVTHTGHTAIDATFYVQGEPWPLLCDTVGAFEDWLLHAARSAERFAIEQQVVHWVLAGAPHDARQLEEAIGQAVTIAKCLSRAPHSEPSRSPYR